MERMNLIEYVTGFADAAHGKQVRKYTGERYIGHPVRVMGMTREYNNDICMHVAALLHDVLEDTMVSAGQIEAALSDVMAAEQVDKVLRLVVELTDVYTHDNYPRMNRRARKEKEAARLATVSADAQTIKYADIIDNVKDIVSQDFEFAKIYIREATRILTVMTNGDATLRHRALCLVEKCTGKLQQPAFC